uniref:EF-hand domain-containing protein n=1 Tax=Hucho hucho TaxID=62062 RepID=A0A4W5NXP2_9TELE
MSMSELESAMIAIIHVFHKYLGHKCKLKKAELKDLINNEMSHFIIVRHSLARLDELFADLDQNGDLEINFQEFIAPIAMMTSTCHALFSTDHHH